MPRNVYLPFIRFYIYIYAYDKIISLHEELNCLYKNSVT